MINDLEEHALKKNFLMMVSPSSLSSDSLSKIYGFSPSSEDVLEAEAGDVVASWISLAASGTLHYVKTASQWLSEFVCKLYELDEDNIEMMAAAYYAFGASLLTYLEDTGSIEIFPHGELSVNLKNMSEYLPPSFLVIPMTGSEASLLLDDEEDKDDD